VNSLSQWACHLHRVLLPSPRRKGRRRQMALARSAMSHMSAEVLETRRLLTNNFAGDWDDQMSEVTSIGTLSSSVLTKTGWITEPTDVDLFQFEAKAGQQISATVLSLSSLTPRLRLFGPINIGSNTVYQELGFAFDGQVLKADVESDATYYVGISQLDNEAYNVFTGRNDTYLPTSTIGKFRLYLADTQPTVDLRGTRFEVTQTTVNAGGFADIEFKVTNSGEQSSGRFDVDLYISDNDIVSQYDTHLKTISIASIAGNSSSPLQNHRVQIPDTFSDTDGTVTIGMLIDADNVVKESNESNNDNRGDYLDLRSIAWGQLPGSTQLTAPRTTTAQRPEFVWTRATDATRYELWVQNRSTGVRAIHESSLTGTSFRPDTALAIADYRVWVRGGNSSGWGDWSPHWDFSIESGAVPGPPKLIGPDGSTADETPTFNWEAAEHASVYDLWVDHIGHKSQVIRKQNLTNTQFTDTLALSAGSYRFWVRAANGAGTFGAWSTGMTFSIGAAPGQPVLIGPTGTTSDTTPAFSWNTTENAVTYDLWVDQRGGQVQIIRERTLTTTEFTPSVGLPEGSYQFWVRATGDGGQMGRWSSAMNFTVSQQAAPEQVTWSDNWLDISADKITFHWNAADRATHYDVWVDNLSTGEQQYFRFQQVSDTSVRVTRSAVTTGDYRIWVRAINAAGPGRWSVHRDAELS
jgi:hypothetical protein